MRAVNRSGSGGNEAEGTRSAPNGHYDALILTASCSGNSRFPRKIMSRILRAFEASASDCSRCALSRSSHRTIDPYALKLPAPNGAESTLTENVASPFQAEPTQIVLSTAIEPADPPITTISLCKRATFLRLT